jgi:GGDEF domain-containing protein
MFQPGKSHSSAVRNLRLPKQSAVPGFADLEFVMEQAHKIPGTLVELPYTNPANKNTFILNVQYDKAHSEPKWSLSQLLDTGLQMLWNHATRDVPLICHMVGTASGNEISDDIMLKGSAVGKPKESHGPGGSHIAVPAPTQTANIPLPQPPSGITFEPPRPGMKSILEGDLTNLQAPNLLQSVNLAKMSGRLDIRSRSETAEVYFQEGVPVHCAVKETLGDAALIELVTWKAGEFRFWPDETTSLKTITKRLDMLLMQGVTLHDQSKYLETNGLRLESCLVKKNQMMSEDELRTRLGKGAPLDFDQQLDFYELIDNRTTLFELLRKRPNTKSEWVPIIFNLVSCGLVQITDQAPTQNRLANLKVLGVDENAVQGVAKNLTRTETGILTFPSFIYFVDQEYLRYEYFNLPFSVIVFSMGQRKDDDSNSEPLKMLAVRRAMQRISLVKRQVDLLGHYETFDYAMLLPNTNSAAASALAHRITDVLREAPLSSDMDAKSLTLAFGVATVPEDCQEMDRVLIVAGKARDRAREQHQRVVLAREVTTQSA